MNEYLAEIKVTSLNRSNSGLFAMSYFMPFQADNAEHAREQADQQVENLADEECIAIYRKEWSS
ncbi:MAG: hypothetical protein H0U53_10970 [Actinobacteria bacterium]|nr:hypothetical protein [Actinomycetota bacterium]